MNVTVTEKDEKKRLDKFLAEQLNDASRSQIQKLIKNGSITVNQQAVRVHYALKLGDVVTLIKQTPPPASDAKGTNNIPPPRIIADEHDFLILEKPAGLLVHPTAHNETNTLVDWLIRHYPDIKQVGESEYRAGIIHRLDRDVSGIMVVPKHNDMYRHLKEQFKTRTVTKQYLALVYGTTEQTGAIDLPIGRNKDGQFVAHPRRGKEKLDARDKIAKTSYEVLEYIKEYSLLLVTIVTGRTHQIRVHLAAIGHPVVGDQLYQTKKKFFHLLRRKIKVVNPGRIFLHSTKIGFTDLGGHYREFVAPLPETLQHYLNELKK